MKSECREEYLKLKPGSRIPDEWIKNKFQDTDTDEMFLELKECPAFLFRIKGNNQYLFYADRKIFNSDTLRLIETFTESPVQILKKEEVKTLPEYLRPYAKKSFYLKDNSGTHLYNEQYEYIGSVNNTAAQEVIPLADIAEPEEKKVIDDEYSEILHEEREEKKHFDINFDYTFLLNKKSFGLTAENNIYILYTAEGKTLLDFFCEDSFAGICSEKELLIFKSESKGLYSMDLNGRVINSCPERFTRLNKDSADKAEEQQDDSYIQDIKPSPPKPEPVRLSEDKIIRNIMKRFRMLLEKHKIKADYFIREKLLSEKTPFILSELYKGNLHMLNEELSHSFEQQAFTSSHRGINLIKAGLLHELYINSTLQGRGGENGSNMRNMINELITYTEDSISLFPEKKVNQTYCKEALLFLKKLTADFPDQKNVLDKLFNKLIADSMIIECANSTDTSMFWFNTLMISKTYEYSTRVDRGDGRMIIDIAANFFNIRSGQ